MNKYLPLCVFILFSCTVITATLYYSPGWGLMDDATNLDLVEKFWKSENKIQEMTKLIRFDLLKVGRFKLLNHFWAVSAYKVFNHSPAGLYVLIAVICLLALPVWGSVIQAFFPNQHIHSTVFLYPLVFFVFTPFWNIFMYISTLEKFVFIFSGLSLYFLLKAYNKNRIISLWVSFLFAILAVFSKETAVSLPAAYCIFSLLDLIIFKKNPRLSWMILASSGLFSGVYFLFMKSFLGGYTSRYASSANLNSMVKNLLAAPLLVKAMLILSIISLVVFFLSRKKAQSVNELFIVIPLYLIFYILVLTPWGYINYLLAPLAPLIMILLFPLYRRKPTRKDIQWIKDTVLIAVVFLLLFFLILPRISKMADIRKMVSFISQQDESKHAQYFLPPPYFESALSIGKFTRKDVIYAEKGTIAREDLHQDSMNFLIFGDACHPVKLNNVGIDDEIYSNNTWKILALREKKGNLENFSVRFPQTFMQRIKDFLKKTLIGKKATE